MNLAPALSVEASRGTPGARCVLLVEDNDLDCEAIERLLAASKTLDLRLVRAGSIKEAITLIASERPAVVVSDLSLPDATGLDAVEALLACGTGFPLIVMTGLEDLDTSLGALHLGAQDYLVKGAVSLDTFERSVRHAIARFGTAQELDRVTGELHQTDEDLDDFVHVVAHDLRAPVRTSRLFADRLLERIPPGDATARELGERLDRALGNVDMMILSMLDYAALRGERPELEAVALRPVIERCLNDVHADLTSVNGSVTVDIHDDHVVLAEQGQLVRVFSNLLANAVKYRATGRPLFITITSRVEESSVSVEIVDNGIGIPAADTDRVFRILERLDPSRSDGLGFGLPICRRILEAWGGQIQAVPHDGEGARFELCLSSPQPGTPRAA